MTQPEAEKHVLIVEDDPAIARALELRLSARGYAVKTAFDAVSAATVARRFTPDVALLDISMPGGDGFLVAERLQAMNANMPFIFITANSWPELRERAEAIGATGFFEKPFVAEELMQAIEAA